MNLNREALPMRGGGAGFVANEVVWTSRAETDRSWKWLSEVTEIG
jgi:hypothetical protein